MRLPDLFEGMQRSAVFGGPGDIYRYELARLWKPFHDELVCCMLNPSNADHEIDDPTILALIHFADLWGYGGLRIINLFAFRASRPSVMFAAEAPIGEHNERHMHAAMQSALEHGGKMLVAWGNDGQDRANFTVQKAVNMGLTLICLGTTLSGAPKHPMARGKHRIPRDQQPIVWRAAA